MNSSTQNNISAVRKRIFLLEDHQILRQGLRLFINQEPDMEVCGEADNGADALSAISALLPEAVVLDISMPGMNGIEFLKNMKALHPEIVAVVLSMHEENTYAERALRAGALGYVMKREGTEEIVAALRKAFKGEYHVSGKIMGSLMHRILGAHDAGDGVPSPMELLSDRELEVFEHIGRGRDTHSIADALHVSPKTVETHRMHIKEKLQINSVAELIQTATVWVEHETTGS